jgi:hypothetical protein
MEQTMKTSLTIKNGITISYENPDIDVHEVDIEVPSLSSELLDIIGGLSKPSKMPGFSYSLSAFRCNVGGAMRKVKASTCSNCYACKGNYIRFPKVQEALQRRYESLFDPRWTAAFIAILQRINKTNKTSAGTFFRWHDSGDLQSMSHLMNIVNIAKYVPGMRFWLPTREYQIVDRYLDTYREFPSNLVVRVSAHMKDRYAPARFSNSSIVVSRDQCFDDILGEWKEAGVKICPAPEQGGVCGTCRNCWYNSVPVVAYKEH